MKEREKKNELHFYKNPQHGIVEFIAILLSLSLLILVHLKCQTSGLYSK